MLKSEWIYMEIGQRSKNMLTLRDTLAFLLLNVPFNFSIYFGLSGEKISTFLERSGNCGENEDRFTEKKEGPLQAF